MRNIAPFLTLIFLSLFFAVASPSFATLDNLGKHPDPGLGDGPSSRSALTFVILCAEIDLSVASIANVTGIAVAYFHAAGFPTSTSPISPCPAGPRSCWRSACARSLGLVNALGLVAIGIPSFIMTLAMMQIAAGRIGGCSCADRSPTRCPISFATLGSASIGGRAVDRHRSRRRCWLAGQSRAHLHALRPFTSTMVGGKSRGRRNIPASASSSSSPASWSSPRSARASRACSASSRISAAPSRTSSTPTSSTRSRPSWSAAPASSAGPRRHRQHDRRSLRARASLNNGLDHVNIDSFLKILIRGPHPCSRALVINVYGAAGCAPTRARNSVPVSGPGIPVCQSRSSPRCFRHGADWFGKSGRLDHHPARETQASRLADRPQARASSIHSKVDIVRKAEDAGG